MTHQIPAILAASAWLLGGLTTFFTLVCVVMILTVLIQRPQGGGLSGAFGSGAGSGQTAFGARTGDALTIATIAMFVVFVVTAVVLNFVARPAAAGGGQDALPATTETETGQTETTQAETTQAETTSDPAADADADDASMEDPQADGASDPSEADGPAGDDAGGETPEDG